MQTIYETSRTLTVTTPRYDLGGGPIRSFILKGTDGSLTVVSPPMHFDEGEFKNLEKIGEVHALVAPNKFHYLGITPWKQRFPKANVYASQTALPRLKKKISAEVLSIEQLKMDPGTHFLSCPGTKNGELLVVCKEEEGWIWYITDLFFNFVEIPKKLFPRIMVQKISGVGVVVNPFCRVLFIRDRKQVKEWLLEKLEEFPQRIVVFSHGDPIHTPEFIQTFKKRVGDRKSV